MSENTKEYPSFGTNKSTDKDWYKFGIGSNIGKEIADDKNELLDLDAQLERTETDEHIERTETDEHISELKNRILKNADSLTKEEYKALVESLEKDIKDNQTSTQARLKDLKKDLLALKARPLETARKSVEYRDETVRLLHRDFVKSTNDQGNIRNDQEKNDFLIDMKDDRRKNYLLSPIISDEGKMNDDYKDQLILDMKEDLADLVKAGNANADGTIQATDHSDESERWFVGEALLHSELAKLDFKGLKTLVKKFGLDITDYEKDPIMFKKKFREELGMRLAEGIPLSVLFAGKEQDYIKLTKQKQNKFIRYNIGLTDDQKKIIDGYLGYSEDEKTFTPDKKAPTDKEKAQEQTIIGRHKKVQEILDKMPTNADKKAFLEKLRLEAIGVMVGGRNGLGASFDISDAMDHWLDTLYIGYVSKSSGQKVIGIGVAKTIYKSDSAKVEAGLINFIPFVNVQGRLCEGGGEQNDPFKDEAKEIKREWSVSAYAGAIFFNTYVGASLDASKVAGVERITKTMGEVLDEVKETLESHPKKSLDDIIQNRTRELSSNEEIAVFKKRIQEIQDTLGRSIDQQGKEHWPDIREGYLAYYRANAFSILENNGIAGSNVYLSGVGGGILFLSHYLPIPFIGISFERFKNNFDGRRRDAEAAEFEIMQGSKSISAKTVTTQDRRVYTRFEKKDVSAISASKDFHVINHWDHFLVSGDIDKAQLIKSRSNA
jgi:hypothetical protein